MLVKMLGKGKNAGICWNEKRKAKQQTIQLEEINQKVEAKEGRLERFQNWVKQYRQNRTFQINKEKFYQQLAGECMKTY